MLPLLTSSYASAQYLPDRRVYLPPAKAKPALCWLTQGAHAVHLCQLLGRPPSPLAQAAQQRLHFEHVLCIRRAALHKLGQHLNALCGRGRAARMLAGGLMRG